MVHRRTTLHRECQDAKVVGLIAIFATTSFPSFLPMFLLNPSLSLKTTVDPHHLKRKI